MNYQDLSWPQLQAIVPNTPVVIPIAAVEQHGPHLPLWTDSLLLGGVLQRAEAGLTREGTAFLTTPLLWLGNSHHHLDFTGTLSASPRTYLDILNDLLENVIHHGFQRILLLNGHGGNMVPASQAVFETRQRHRKRSDLLLLSATYWQCGAAAHPSIGQWSQEEMGHACEWETSMVLELRPDLVGNYRDLPVISPAGAFAPAARGWITNDRSQPGYLGNPAAASKEKGDALLNHFSAGVVGLVKKIARWDGVAW